MNTRSAPGVLSFTLAFALGACQAGVAPTPSVVVPPPTAAPTSTPLGEHVVAEWSVPSPGWMFIGRDSVWIQDHRGAVIARIDPASNTSSAVADAATAEQPPVTQGFGSVWIANSNNTLDRVAPTDRSKVLATIILDAGLMDIWNAVLVTPAAVWVYESDKAELLKIDPATNHIVSRTPWTTLIAEAKAKTKVPAGKGTDFLWLHMAGDEGGGVGLPKGLLRLDPNSGAGLTFLPWSADHEGDGPIIVTDNAVWHSAGGHIYRIDVATNQIVATYPSVTGIVHLAIGFGSVWLANYEGSLVQRLDIVP